MCVHRVSLLLLIQLLRAASHAKSKSRCQECNVETELGCARCKLPLCDQHFGSRETLCAACSGFLTAVESDVVARTELVTKRKANWVMGAGMATGVGGILLLSSLPVLGQIVMISGFLSAALAPMDEFWVIRKAQKLLQPLRMRAAKRRFLAGEQNALKALPERAVDDNTE